MKSTQDNGKLTPLTDKCYLISDLEAGGPLYSTGLFQTLVFDNLPDISDKKSAKYNDETAIGRTAPFKVYANSENRTISVDCHFYVQEQSGPQSAQAIKETLYWLEAHVYPKKPENGTYSPPPMMEIKCFSLLSEDPLCVVLNSYNVKFDPQVPWDEDTGIPYKLDVTLDFEVVYQSSDMPYAEDIVATGGE